jgi:hypothetical protein
MPISSYLMLRRKRQITVSTRNIASLLATHNTSEVMASDPAEETDQHTIERRFRTPRDSQDIEVASATLSEEIDHTTVET